MCRRSKAPGMMRTRNLAKLNCPWHTHTVTCARDDRPKDPKEESPATHEMKTSSPPYHCLRKWATASAPACMHVPRSSRCRIVPAARLWVDNAKAPTGSVNRHQPTRLCSLQAWLSRRTCLPNGDSAVCMRRGSSKASQEAPGMHTRAPSKESTDDTRPPGCRSVHHTAAAQRASPEHTLQDRDMPHRTSVTAASSRSGAVNGCDRRLQ
jgi:hypothetical protein